MSNSAVIDGGADFAPALARMTQAELDQVYAAGLTAPLPDGKATGLAILFPGSGLTPLLAKLSVGVWQGKTFDARAGALTNQVFGFDTLRANVYPGASWFDSGDAVIIDYAETTRFFTRIRDEIREVRPGYWLGRSYYRSGPRGRFVLSFGLDFRPR